MPARAAGRAALGLGVNGQWHSEGGGAAYSYEAAPAALDEAREADGAPAGAAGAATAGAAAAPAAAAEGADTSVAAVEVEAVEPGVGSTEGGELLQVQGGPFEAGVRCSFGTVSGVASRWMSGGEVECVSPAHEAGAVPVHVEAETAAGARVRSVGAARYVYAERGEALSVVPEAGPSRAATEVLVQGVGLSAGQALGCVVGGRVVSGAALSPTEASCLLPPGAPGFVGVSLSGGHGEEGAVFLYRESAHVSGLAPRGTWADRGTLVHVAGQGMVGAEAACRAGGGATAGHAVSSALVVCEVFAEGGAEEVEVTVGSWGEAAAVGVVSGSPVTSVAPSAGPEEGGTVVEVGGTGVGDTKGLHCVVGTLGPVSARWLGSRAAECTMPARAADTVPVAFSLGSVPFDFVGSVFRYVQGADLDAVQYFGVERGRTTFALSVTGQSLQQELGPGCYLSTSFGLASKLGFYECDFLQGMDVGFSELLLEEQNYGSLPFEVRELTVFKRIYPDIGILSGGTISFATGSDFGVDTACSYGNETLPSTFISSGLIACPSPALDDSGVMTFKASQSFGPAHGSGYFAIFPDIHVRSIGIESPAEDFEYFAAGPEGGGTATILSGQNFVERVKTFCKFGTVSVMAHLTTHTAVQCLSPAHADGLVDVSVSQNGHDFLGRASFDFYR